MARDIKFCRILIALSLLSCSECLAQVQELNRKLQSGDPQQLQYAKVGFETMLRQGLANHDSDTVVFASLSIATCDYHLGDRSRAKDALEQLARDYPEHRLLVLVHRDLGMFCQMDWESKRAEKHLEKAVRLARKMGLSETEIAKIQLSRAVNYVVLGNNEAARLEFEKVSESLRSAQDLTARYIRADCDIQLSELDKRNVSSSSAIGRLRTVLESLKPIKSHESIERQFSCHHGLSYFFRELTRFEDAKEELDRAEELLNHNKKLLGSIRFNRHAEELAIATGELRIEMAASYFDVQSSKERVEDQITFAEQAAQKAHQLHKDVTEQETKESGSTLAILAAVNKLRGRLHTAEEDHEAAQSCFTQAHDHLQSAISVFHTLLNDPLHDVVLEFRRERVGILHKLGRIDEAINESEELLRHYLVRYGKNSIQTAAIYQQAISLFAQAGKQEQAINFASTHRTIANEYLLSYATGLTPASLQRFFRRWNDPALHDALSLAVNGNSCIEESTEWLLNSKARSAEVLARVNQKLQDHANRDDVLKAIEQQSFALYGSPTDDSESQILSIEYQKRQLAETHSIDIPFTWHRLEDLQELLHEDEALIDVFYVKDTNSNRGTYFAWVITTDGPIRIQRLGNTREIDTLVEALVNNLEEYGGPDSLESTPEVLKDEKYLQKEFLRPISELVLDPIWKLIENKERWIISPDGSLWSLPWATLIASETGEYAIERATIRYVISARDVFFRNEGESHYGPPVIVADPAYNHRPPHTDGVWRKEKAGDLNTEAMEVYSRLRRMNPETKLIFHDKADKYALLSLQQPPGVLYLSTHGKFLEPSRIRVDDPFLCCYVALAGYNFVPGRTTYPLRMGGILTGSEVLLQNLKGTDLVVLSACQTGRGVSAYGHSAASLRHAFHLAGARAVVSTLWSVADEPTNELMKRFIDDYIENPLQDKADLLHKVQLQMVQRLREGRYQTHRNLALDYPAHPFLWGAFSVSGF